MTLKLINHVFSKTFWLVLAVFLGCGTEEGYESENFSCSDLSEEQCERESLCRKINGLRVDKVRGCQSSGVFFSCEDKGIAVTGQDFVYSNFEFCFFVSSFIVEKEGWAEVGYSSDIKDECNYTEAFSLPICQNEDFSVNNGYVSACQTDSDCQNSGERFFEDGIGSDSPECISVFTENSTYSYCSECSVNGDCGDDESCFMGEFCVVR